LLLLVLLFLLFLLLILIFLFLRFGPAADARTLIYQPVADFPLDTSPHPSPVSLFVVT
jgi:hypothetical protein